MTDSLSGLIFWGAPVKSVGVPPIVLIMLQPLVQTTGCYVYLLSSKQIYVYIRSSVTVDHELIWQIIRKLRDNNQLSYVSVVSYKSIFFDDNENSLFDYSRLLVCLD